MKEMLLFTISSKIKSSTELIYLYVFFISCIALIGFLAKSADATPPIAIVWIVLLFTWTVSIGHFWNEDEQDGSIDQWRTNGVGLEWVALAKWAVQGALVVLPVAIIASWGMKLMGFTVENPAYTAFIVSVSGLQMTAIGMMAAAATVNVQRASGIVGLVMLPMAIPSMVWGSSALLDADNTSSAAILCGYALLSIPLSCIASAASLRASE